MAESKDESMETDKGGVYSPAKLDAVNSIWENYLSMPHEDRLGITQCLLCGATGGALIKSHYVSNCLLKKVSMGALIHDGELVTETSKFCYPMFCFTCDTVMMGYFEKKIAGLKSNDGHQDIFTVPLDVPIERFQLDVNFVVFSLLQIWRSMLVEGMHSGNDPTIKCWRNHVHLFLEALSVHNCFQNQATVLKYYNELREKAPFHMHFFVDTKQTNESLADRLLSNSRFGSFEYGFIPGLQSANFSVRVGRFHFCLCQDPQGDWFCMFDGLCDARFPGFVGSKPISAGWDEPTCMECLEGVSFPKLGHKQASKRMWNPCNFPSILKNVSQIRAYKATLASMYNMNEIEQILVQSGIGKSKDDLRSFLLAEIARRPEFAIACVADRDVMLTTMNLRKCTQSICGVVDASELYTAMCTIFGFDTNEAVLLAASELTAIEVIQQFSAMHHKTIKLIPTLLLHGCFDDDQVDLFLVEDLDTGTFTKVDSLCGCLECDVLLSVHNDPLRHPCDMFKSPIRDVMELFRAVKRNIKTTVDSMKATNNGKICPPVFRRLLDDCAKVRHEIQAELIGKDCTFCDYCFETRAVSATPDQKMCSKCTRSARYCDTRCETADRGNHECECKGIQVYLKATLAEMVKDHQLK